QTGPDGSDIGQVWDRDRRRPVGRGAITELAPLVVSPCKDGSIILAHGQAVVYASRYRSDGDGHGHLVGYQLVVTPNPNGAGCGEGETMSDTGGDLHDRRQPEDVH